MAALTFDDGPHARFTPILLDLLEQHGARATFFVIGKHAARHRQLLRRMADAGHVIANHSWDHPSFALIGRRARIAQVRGCARAIAPWGTRLFRPPYGDQSLRSRLDLFDMMHRVVMFDCEVGDWYETDPIRMARDLIAGVRPGSIIALHDALRWNPSKELVPKYSLPTHPDRRAMLAALEMFLKQMEGRMRFVTVPELLRHGPPRLENWYQVREGGGYQPAAEAEEPGANRNP